MGRIREEDKQKLLTAHDNSETTVAWSEEGGGLVYRVYDVFVLFDVPQYGGRPRYVETFDESQVDKLLDLVYSWS
jgi:hypothetical protein